MATYRIEFTPASGIEPQEQTVDAESVIEGDDEYTFRDERNERVRVVRKEVVAQIVRE